MKQITTSGSGTMDDGSNGFTFDDLAAIYAELRPMASNLMKGERPGHSLHTTALMHAALERLMGSDWKEKAWQNPGHFVEAFCRNMRYVLVDHARRRAASKRGGDAKRVPYNDALEMCAQKPQQLIDINDLLASLAVCDTLTEPQRKAQVVELRVFGNLTEDEIATIVGASPATVRRDWQQAKAWLATELARSSEAT
jgi:RNA polymerase sigma factor (TIGR02999 family)